MAQSKAVSQYHNEQAELLEAIVELKKNTIDAGIFSDDHTVKLWKPFKLYRWLKRITNCMRKHGIRANIRKKKRNRIQRASEEYINHNLPRNNSDSETKNEVWVTDTTEVGLRRTH